MQEIKLNQMKNGEIQKNCFNFQWIKSIKKEVVSSLVAFPIALERVEAFLFAQ